MKRNCNNCKALTNSFIGIGCRCQLNYEIKPTEYYQGIPISYKPLEDCPKPTTINKFFKCKPKKSN